MLWLPLIGPIIQGLLNTGSSIYMKFKDTELGKLKTNRESDVAEAQISAQIIRDTNDDLALRILRDIYCTPACIHLFLVSWDTFIAETRWINHSWMWHTASYPLSYAWYPTTVAVFLLGNIGLNMWKRK